MQAFFLFHIKECKQFDHRKEKKYYEKIKRRKNLCNS
jgi:hypothetical protein